MDNKKVTIGRYLIIKTIGRGGMGEVLLAYDPICKREIAIKKIRPDLSNNTLIKKRFLKEAKIASQLFHPSIIPIHAIHIEEDNTYYTMPYVEGKLLKEALEEIKNKDDKTNDTSIATLARIFLRVCEAMAYTHSKNILHRDLKPSNIIIGKYGEVFILDWGIASFIDKPSKDIDIKIDEEKLDITKPGKIAGTVAFMAPERVFGKPSSIQTDIYALGVILYQILTLSSPFRRHNLAYFKKYAKQEKLINPIDKSPKREIPNILSDIATKCLDPDIKKRYKKIEEIIKDLKTYIEGKPKWLFLKDLDINKKKDWNFKENLFLPKQTTITQSMDSNQWFNLCLTEIDMSENTTIKANISFKKDSLGFGFVISSPKKKNKIMIEEGYLIWIDLDRIKLFRSKALVLEKNIKNLKPNKTYQIKIIKEKRKFHICIDGINILNYYSKIPYHGSHFGILYKESDFKIKNMKIFSASNPALVSCLAIPDAFLAKQNYDLAYEEYKKIQLSFPGRDEGHRAIYRSGMTLLEKAKAKNDKDLFQKSLDIFDLLHNTPSGPLEYIGKATVYAEIKDFEEEAKCLELAIRKFKDHPLSPIVKEHMIYRLHESSLENQKALYNVLLISILHIPSIANNKDISILIKNLEDNLEPLYFISSSNNSLAIDLAFRIGKKNTLLEIASTTKDKTDIENVFFCFLEFYDIATAKKLITNKEFPFLFIAISANKSISNSLKTFFKKAPRELEKTHIKTLIYILNLSLDNQDFSNIKKVFEILKNFTLSKESNVLITAIYIKSLLLERKFNEAKIIFASIKKEDLKNENSPFFTIYGIFLYATKDKKIATNHLMNFLENSYPKTTTLLSHFLTEKIEKWFKNAFFFEKKELYKQLYLFYHSKNQEKKSLYFKKLGMHKL